MGRVRAVPHLYIVVYGLSVCTIFSTSSDKRYDIMGGVIDHKVCVLNLGNVIPLLQSVTSSSPHKTQHTNLLTCSHFLYGCLKPFSI